jgi:hypothetical protein
MVYAALLQLMRTPQLPVVDWTQKDNCINTTSGIITLKRIEWSKITKIARTHRNLIVTIKIRCVLAILVILNHSVVFRVIIPEVVLIQLSSWGWAQCCSKHIEDSNKHIIKKIVHQVGNHPELYEDARSEKYKIHLSLLHGHNKTDKRWETKFVF